MKDTHLLILACGWAVGVGGAQKVSPTSLIVDERQELKLIESLQVIYDAYRIS